MAVAVKVPVFVNVYRLIPAKDKVGKTSNDALEYINMGVYHAGIEIFGQEYSFGMDPSGSRDPNVDGIFVCRPRSAVGDFKEQLLLGEVAMDKAAFAKLLDGIRPQWRAVSYHILKHNCCYFSHALAVAISASFDDTFPHYVYRAAGMGGKVLPDAVVMSITDALSPPTSVPDHLINKLEVKTGVTPPKPGAPRQAAAASGIGSSVFGFAKDLTKKVKAAVGKEDVRLCTKAFPEIDPADITANFGCHVEHVGREQHADVFVTAKGLCFVGENKLALLLPWASIASLSYGTRAKSATGFGRDYSAVATRPDGHGCLLVFTTDGRMIPMFHFTGFGDTVGAAIGKITGNKTDERLEKAFDEMDEAWRRK